VKRAVHRLRLAPPQRRAVGILIVLLLVVAIFDGLPIGVVAATQRPIVPPGMTSKPIKLNPTFPTPMAAHKSASAHLPPPSAHHTTPAIPTTPHTRETWTSLTHSVGNPDGSVTTQVSVEPAFRLNGKTWVPIDSTVRPSALPGQPLSAEGAIRPIRFGDSANRLVEFELDGGAVTISSQGLVIGTPVLIGDTVTYFNVAPDTDLRYTLTDGELKEELILKSGKAPLNFSFHISDPKGSLGSAHPRADGSTRFDLVIDSELTLDLAPAFAFKQPAVGSPAQIEANSAHLKLVRAGNGFDVTESVDPIWLAGKQYPIVLDPTVKIDDTNGMYAAYTYYNPSSGCPGCTGQYSDGLVVGTFTDSTYNLEPVRSFFSFNLSAVPAQATVSSATLTTNVFTCVRWSSLCGSNSYTLELHPLTSANWGSTSTYSQLLAITDLNTVFSSLSQASFTQNVGSNCWTTDSCSSFTETFTLTSQVQKWINGTAANDGFAVKLQNEAYNIGGPSWCYKSAYCSGNPHPSLTIVYTSVPQAPQSVTAAAGDQSATVNWVAPYTASPITSYSIQAYNTNNQAVGNPVTCTTCTTNAIVPGLSNGLTYYFAVTANNSYGSSPTVNSNNVTLPVVISALVVNPQSIYARGQFLSFSTTVSNPVGVATATVSSLTDTGLPIYAPQGSSFTEDGSACNGTTTPSCTISNGAFSVSSFTLNAGQSHTFTYSAIAVGNDRGCTSVADTMSAATSGSVTSHAGMSEVVCAAGMGDEPWWSYVERSLGGGATAAVNPADGNLMLSQVDSTPVQAHGQLAYTLLRTYNSQDPGLYSFPGNLAAGWTMSVGGAGNLGADAGESGLYVPPQSTIANPFAVTLIDRSGDRLVFSARLPQFTAFDPTGVSGPLAATAPKGLAIDTIHYNHVCVDAAFAPPPGVHMGLWRYLEINSSATSNWCGSPATWTASAILGYAAERPDRIRYEFTAGGQLVDMADGSGVELRYLYDGSSRLTTVYEPRSCSNPSTATCRAYRFTYLTGETDVVDPAGRTTKYIFDTATPAHLTKVVNPDASQLVYAYGICTGASTNQLCSATDPRGNATSFTYSAAPLSAPRIATITDRLGHQTVLSYYTSPDYVTANLSLERVRYQAIDSSGRVGEVDQGDTSDNYLRQSLYTWDVIGGTCRQPDTVIDNNLCKLVRKSITTATPDESTAYTYNSEGKLLAKHQANNFGPASLDSTNGFNAEYIEASGVVNQFVDSVAGSGTVTSAGTVRADAKTVFTLSDLTQVLSPRGNAAGSGYATYLTSYKVDNLVGATPGAVPTGTICTATGGPSNNSGHVCEMDQPTFDGSHPTVTRYTYDAFGQKATMTTPKAIAESLSGQYIYTYWTDADLDLSANVSAGGWQKAVTDPKGNFVAFAQDRAGNVVRTWDRNATQGHVLANTWNNQASPPSTSYSETIYGSYSAPWRFLTSSRDQLGDLTTYLSIDANGNVHTIRPPRGNLANNSSYDITQTFDNGDELLTKLMPAEAAANKPTTYGYDPYGNRSSNINPDGSVTVTLYDAVNRAVGTKWTRAAWPSDTTQVPTACTSSQSADAPLPANRIMCSTAITYDGVDNILQSFDGNQQGTGYQYDAIHRQVHKLSPRFDGTLNWLSTDTVYDPDGHITDLCPPRELSEGFPTCTSSSYYSEHFTFDAMGRTSSSTAYQYDQTSVTDTTTKAYDADGNLIQVTDANGHVTTYTYDVLDRKLTLTSPRDATTAYTTNFYYDAAGNTTSVVRDAGTGHLNLTTAFSYDAANRLVDSVQGSDNQSASTAGAVDSVGGKNIRTRLVYDADRNVIARVLPGAFTNWPATIDYSYMERTNYDVDGRPVVRYQPRYDNAVPDPGLSSTTQTAQCTTSPNPSPQPATPAYPSGVGLCLTQLQYDPAGNTSEEILATTDASHSNRYVKYYYTDDNLISSVESPNPASDGSRVTSAIYLYDGVGRQVKSTDANGIQQTTAYTSDGLTATVVEQPNQTLTHKQSWSYDANGNKRTWTQYTGATWNYYYYSDNRQEYVYDPASNETQYSYDKVGNVTRVESPSGSARDANNPNSNPTVNTYTFDNLLLTANVPIAPNGNVGHQSAYTYDGVGRKATETANQINYNTGAFLNTAGAITYAYYQDDRLQQETGRTGQYPELIGFQYDPAGSQSNVTDYVWGGSGYSNIVDEYSYYLDESVRTQFDLGGTSTFSYDGLGQPVARQDAALISGFFTTSYSYLDSELPGSMASSIFNISTTWKYDPGGRPSVQYDPNGDATTWLWNTDNTIQEHNLQSSSPVTNLADWKFTYDQNYHLTVAAMTGRNAAGAAISKTFNYGYDFASRVTSYNNGSGVTAATWDHDGNRLTYGGASFTYNADDSPSTSGITYTYIGGVQTDTCNTYTYDGFDRLQKVVSKGGTGCPAAYTMTYQYDGLDHQVSFGEPSAPTFTREFHFDALSGTPIDESQPGLQQSGQTDIFAFEVDPNGRKHGLQSYADGIAQTQQVLNDDGRGSITSVVNTNQSVACIAFLDPWGSPTSPGTSTSPCYSGSTLNMYFYHGARLDPKTGNYQLGSRTYDPTKTSFLTPDSFREEPSSADLSIGNDPLTQNRYGYVNGDPVNLIDPTGHCSTAACFEQVNADDGSAGNVTAGENLRGWHPTVAFAPRPRSSHPVAQRCPRGLCSTGSSDSTFVDHAVQAFFSDIGNALCSLPPCNAIIGSYEFLSDPSGYMARGQAQSQAQRDSFGALASTYQRAANGPVGGVPFAAADLTALSWATDRIGDFEKDPGAGTGHILALDLTVIATRGIPELAPEAAGGAGDIFVIGKQADTAAYIGKPGFNVLNLPKEEWSLANNEAWVQGGMDRGAPFMPTSEPNPATVFNSSRGELSVFGRELRQLFNGGYDIQGAQQGELLWPGQEWAAAAGQ
jgi:RHS repeat-associated protein